MMPPHQPTAGANPRLPAAFDQHIASSNATATAFLGGRQPSWMTPGAAPKKTPHPRPTFVRPSPSVGQVVHPPPLPQQHQYPQQQQAVLPSPAPSDEPSPALSSALDSPIARSFTLTDAQNFVPGSATASTPAMPPVTGARFVHELPDSPVVPEAPAPDPAGHPPVFGNQSLQSAVSGPQDSQVAHNRVPSSGGPSSAHGTAPPPKRRRTDQPSYAQPRCSSLLEVLQSHVQSCGGDQALEPGVERPRVLLLTQACRADDEFFIVLHQLFSMWSLDPQQAQRCLPQGREIIDSAFTILETVLKKNQSMSTAFQQWFARFPVPFEQFGRGPIGGADVVMHIATFLRNLVREYDSLITAALKRGYPLLVDELLSRLACTSPVLQFIFFTACRRRLGVPDDSLGTQSDQEFRNDQESHRNPATGRLVLTPIAQAETIEQRNAPRIGFYKTIVAAAAASRISAQANVQSFRVPSAPSPLTPLQQAGLRDPSCTTNSHTPQNPQHFQTIYSPTLVSKPFAPIYPSSAIPVPSQAPAGPLNPYAGLQSANGAAEAQSTPSNNDPVPSAQRQPLHIITQHHPAAASRMVNQAPQHQIQPQWIPQPPQLVAPRQQPMPVLHQYNQQQYQWNSQITADHPVQVNYQAAAHPLAAPSQLSSQAQPTPDLRQQQLQYIQWTQQAQPSFANPSRPAVGPAPPVAAPVSPQVPVQQTQRNVAPRKRGPPANDCLLPLKGTTITRQEWPPSPSDEKSIMMALHQAHVRSPKRVARAGERDRLYQAVKSLPVGPASLAPKNSMYQFRFEITEEDLARAATAPKQSGISLPVVEHFNGALRWRIRCCVVPTSLTVPTEQQWATLDTSWPTNIFMTLNHHVLNVRRQHHNGKDLATEITDFVVSGTNVLSISCPDLGRQRAGQNRFVAVEMLETLSHSAIVSAIWSRGTIPEAETLETIKKRLAPSSAGDDDEVSFQAEDFSIDLADPHSATIFKTPARGANCTHMECFDLETWLATRPGKPTAKCPHRLVKCACPNTPEPSNPDKWRCPICSRDARPYSLRIDGFLLKVRAQLEAEGKLRAKSMRVKADGSWTAVLESEDDGSSDGEGLGAAPRPLKAAAVALAASSALAAATGWGRGVVQPPAAVVTGAGVSRREVEVIEID